MSHLNWLKDYKIPRKKRMQSVIVKVFNKLKPNKTISTSSSTEKPSTYPASTEVNGGQQLHSESAEVHKAVSVRTQTIDAATEYQLLITVPNPQNKNKRKRIKCFQCRRWNHVRAKCPDKVTVPSKQEVNNSPTNLSVWSRLGDQPNGQPQHQHCD